MSNAETIVMNEIDARFPYDRFEQCKALIDRGIKILPNAAFGALHGICRPPFGVEGLADRLVQLLSYWRSQFDHPVADMLSEVATSMIFRHELSVEEAIARMRILASFDKLYAALSIVYFGCDDVEGKFELIIARIRARWDALIALD